MTDEKKKNLASEDQGKINMVQTKPKEKRLFNFTEYGIQIEAISQEEANKKLKEKLKKKK